MRSNSGYSRGTCLFTGFSHISKEEKIGAKAASADCDCGVNITPITRLLIFHYILTSRNGENLLLRWQSHEVLLNPDTIIQLATQLKTEKQQRAMLETQIEEQRPKVIFADAVSVSKTSILIGELAKLLKQNNFEMGQNRLFRWLRENCYLIKRKGNDYNLPTQYSMELGLFEIKETVITHSDGRITTSKTPMVTGKGQIYFINKFKEQISA